MVSAIGNYGVLVQIVRSLVSIATERTIAAIKAELYTAGNLMQALIRLVVETEASDCSVQFH